MMNFTEPPTVPIPREFLAVVLAGFGNDLVPLTNDYGEQPCPKALLPIVNKPMISSPLLWLEESGIKDVLLICPSSHRAAISHYINSDPSSSALSSLSIDIQTFDHSPDLSVASALGGTCSILRHFAHRIDGDFVLLPCDFVPPPSLSLTALLDKFRVENATDGAIATSLWFEAARSEKEKGAPDDAWSVSLPPTAVLYDEKTGTLLHVDTPDDLDNNSDELELRMGMLWKYPRTKLTTSLVDSHVYVCKRTVLDALAQKPRFDSIREEFMPWLCKVQTQKTKRVKYGKLLSTIPNSPMATQSLALQHSTLYLPPWITNTYSSRRPSPNASSLENTYPFSKPPTLAATASPGLTTDSIGVDAPRLPASRVLSLHTEASSTAPPSPTLSLAAREASAGGTSLRVGLIVHRLADGYAARANNLWNYLELNRKPLQDLPQTSHDPALIDPRSSISNDSLVGESTRLGERSSVKKSVVGPHCVIGRNVKIAGCVLMDHCVIEDGAKLEGCVLGKNTRVGAKAELVRCVTQAGYEVEAGGVYKHEKLDVSDWTAGPVGVDVEDDEAVGESDDEEDEEEGESGSDE